MKILLLYGMLSLSSLLCGVSYAEEFGTDEACNCDHCFKTNAEKNETEDDNSPVSLLNKEDADGDGRLQICARGRDLPDQSFLSVCHMLCHNRCTRYRVVEIIEGTVKRNIVVAYRNNYYKLRDGPCRKF